MNSKGLHRSTHGTARYAAVEPRAVGPGAASLLLLLLLGTTAVRAQTVGRLIDVIDVSDRGNRVDIVLQFNCSLRLLGHTPQREGAELRLRLRPDRDCGLSPAASIAFELAPLSGAGGIITAARLDSVIAGEAALSITFARSETFFVAQGTDARGMRVRLVRSSTRGGAIVVQEPTDVIANFAINLESQREPFDPQAVELAAKRLKTPAFVSTVEVDGQKYYRLRVGPIDRRSVAERVLRAAAKDYPRAWLAIGDDNRTSDPMAAGEVGLPGVEPLGADSPLEPAARKTLLSQARKAMRERDYPQAIALLTRLQRQPQFPERHEVQELLGLSRERAGQLAHAKAEYEEYLRRYPEADAAPRVRQRLRILRAASLDGKQGTGLDEEDTAWRFSGGASQLYRRDSTETDIAGNTTVNTVSQNAVYNDVDFLARRGGDRFDLNARVSGGYAKDLLSDGPGDRSRVSTAFFELNDRRLSTSGRFGRQSRGADGVLGTFDGLSLSYGFKPSWTVSTAAGLPVESSADGPSTDRQFLAVALGYAPEYSPWEVSTFITRQQFDGLQDRQAVGVETRYFAPNRSLSALIDYDLGFSSLNAAVLFGTLLLPARWTLSFDLERRNAPVLTARNALIGQAVRSIDDLRATFTDDQILDLAQDRTPVLSTYSLSTSRPIGVRFQIAADVIGVEIGDTPASGGVAAQPGTGLDVIYQFQVFGNSLLRNGDFNVLAFRYNSGSAVQLASASLMSRFPVFGTWRVSPRLRVDERTFTLTGGSQRTLVPSLRVDYLRNRTLFELEVGAELGELEQALQTNDSTRFFVGLGYRLGF